MAAPERSKGTFRLIQIGTAVGLLLLFGAAFASMWLAWGSHALAAIVVGGVISLAGVYMATMAAPRIYDPSKSVTLDRYEEGYERHDLERVHVERHVGQEEATYTRAGAIQMTVRGVVVGFVGVGLGYAIYLFL